MLSGEISLKNSSYYYYYYKSDLQQLMSQLNKEPQSSDGVYINGLFSMHLCIFCVSSVYILCIICVSSVYHLCIICVSSVHGVKAIDRKGEKTSFN